MLKQRGYRIVATSSSEGDPVLLPLLRDFDVTQKTALVFGTEGDGLSDEAKTRADAVLKIPMYGFTDCSNIFVALALCLHDLTTRLRHSSVEWHLQDEEKYALRSEWIKNLLGERLPELEREFRRRTG